MTYGKFPDHEKAKNEINAIYYNLKRDLYSKFPILHSYKEAR